MIIDKILKDARIISEAPRKEPEVIRVGNHETKPEQFLQALGITRESQDPNNIQELRNYIVQGMAGGFLSTMIVSAQMEQERTLAIEFQEEFHDPLLGFNSLDEKIAHFFGSLVEALRKVDYIGRDSKFEYELVSNLKYRVYEKQEND